MALGQVIVRQLELQDRGTVLERWLAHLLAEVIGEADQAAGPAKEACEARAVDLILKLWVHRRALPEQVDPLGGYRKAIEVLGHLMPDANPWARCHRSDTYDGQLREMFELMVKIVLAGVSLTQVSRVRPVTDEELKALEDEERHLHSTLEKWMRVVARSSSRPEIEIAFIDPGTVESADTDRKSGSVGGFSEQEHTSDGHEGQDEVSLHAEIVSNLELMQAELTDLLTRWRKSSPGKTEGEDENLDGSVEGSAATKDGCLDTSREGEVSREKGEADTAGEIQPES